MPRRIGASPNRPSKEAPVGCCSGAGLQPGYSYRSASIGSTRLARRAGNQTAASATSVSTIGHRGEDRRIPRLHPEQEPAIAVTNLVSVERRGEPDRDADDRERHPFEHHHPAHPTDLRRRAPGGCPSPASAGRPSRPSARRCRSPRAASADAPNTVISHMLKRCRDVDSDTMSSIDRTSETGRPVTCRSCSCTALLTECGATRVRTTHFSGEMPQVERVHRPGPGRCGTVHPRARIVVEAAVAHVADDADDLPVGLAWRTPASAACRWRAGRSADRLSARTGVAIASLMMTTGGDVPSSRSVNARPRLTGILKTSK